MSLPAFLAKPAPKSVRFWLFLSLAFNLSYSLLGLKVAFSQPYVVQDDARQHVFWMFRLIDPSWFPNDFIADYFQAVAPIGYTAVYQVAISLGINPFIWNKLLPTAISLVTTGYCFGLSLELFSVPVAGFISALVFSQNMWFKDDIISATPRAFAYPLLLAFLYYLVRGSLWPMLGAIALLGLFYPQAVLMGAGILVLRLFTWDRFPISFSSNRRRWIFAIAGLSVAFIILLPFALSSSEYDPTITVEQAKALPEFWPHGRSSFFRENPIDFYFFGNRSGMFPRSLFTPVTLCAGLLLPIFAIARKRIPLMSQLSGEIQILPQILLSSVILFFAAHALLFQLHLPSRYTGATFRIAIAIATGISLSIILDRLWWRMASQITARRLLAGAGIGAIAISLMAYPLFVNGYPKTAYRVGLVPELYQFLQQQPRDITIASIGEEANNIPSFSQRAIFVGREYAIPYQMGYYGVFRQRLVDLVRALYSPRPQDLQKFLADYRIHFFLLDPNTFTPEYLANQRWIQDLQIVQESEQLMQRGEVPVLATLVPQCQALETQGMILVNAECIQQRVVGGNFREE